jgi:hypothetical protein
MPPGQEKRFFRSSRDFALNLKMRPIEGPPALIYIIVDICGFLHSNTYSRFQLWSSLGEFKNLIGPQLAPMLGLAGASRRLGSLNHACALLDSAPAATEALASSLTSLLSLGHLHTAAGAVELSTGQFRCDQPCYALRALGLIVTLCSAGPSPSTAATTRASLLALTPAAAATFAAPIDASHLLARPGSMIGVAKAMERLLRASSPGAAAAPHAFPSQLGRLCGRPFEVADEAADGEIGEWRADSVRRKRKKKMNKHKHAKRRKLNRHRR